MPGQREAQKYHFVGAEDDDDDEDEGIVRKGSFAINVRVDIFSRVERGLEIFKKRPDISTLGAFSSGNFRSLEREERGGISKIEMSSGH